MPASPFRGLTPFGEGELDAVLFFGRDREREVIVANLMASRLTLLYGPSGVGKSSLLRAGVAYHLRRIAAGNVARGEPPQLGVVFFSGWSEEPVSGIIRAAADEVERLVGQPPTFADGADLAEALDICAAAVGGELYVILDQVEEYFTYRDRRNGAGDRFAGEFSDAVNRREVRAHFVLALREDELARLDAFKASIPGVFANFLRLDRLDRRAARDAIVGPLQAWNDRMPESVTAEPALVEAVLDEVSVARITAAGGPGNGSATDDGARIEAPYLQLVMQRVWEAERAAGSSVLRVKTLASLGGAQRVVGEHLERALAGLDPADKDAAARMFTYLVTPSGSKIAHAPRDLADYAGVDQRRAEAVLGALATERILRPVEAPGGDGARYEIFHDVLGDTVMSWRAAYVAERRLEREQAAARRRQRQLLVVALAALVGLAVVGSIALYALHQRSDARENEAAAAAGALVANARAALDTDPELAMLLVLEAADGRRDADVEDVLRRALLLSRVRGVMPRRVAPAPPDKLVASNGSIRAVARGDRVRWRLRGRVVAVRHGARAHVNAVDVGRSGRVLTAGSDRVARLWSPRGRLLHEYSGHSAPLLDATLSPDESRVATASVDGTARIWNTSDEAVVATLFGHANFVTAVTFSPDAKGGVLATASRDGTARLWDGVSGTPFANLTGQHRGSVIAAAFTAGGRRLLTWGRDGTVREWDAVGEPQAVRARTPAPAAPKTTARSRLGARAVAIANTVRLSVPGRAPVMLRGHAKQVTAVSFSPDGRLLVTASKDFDARLWDGVEGRYVGLLRQHFGPVADAAFSPDGRWIVTAGPSKVGLWEVASRRFVFFVRGGEDRLAAARFSGLQTIVMSDTSGSVRTYRCDVCVGLSGLTALATRRHALTGRVLTAEERRR